MSATMCFYAYSSHTVSAEFIVSSAIDLINEDVKDVYVQDWKTMPTAGTRVMSQVCKDIDDCDVFLCDLTDLNPNVLFELGYAIATDKRIWLTRLDDKKATRSFYDELGLLETIGYVAYSDAYQIRDSFKEQAPYRDLLNTLFRHKINPLKSIVREPKLLYLKSPMPNDDSDSLSRYLLKSDPKPLIDDPSETKNRTLEWYIDNILGAFGVIIHFAPQEHDAKNARLAFVSGMTFGLAKKPLMLVQAPYSPAFDYKDLMFIYGSIRQRNDKLAAWLSDRAPDYNRMLAKYSRYTNEQEKLQALLELRNINLGEYEAEAEKDQLGNYFVESDSYTIALGTSNYMIFSGRKGSGKTANFFQIGQILRKDSDKSVCYIKPIAYHLQGVYELFRKRLPKSTKAHVVETLWKFLLYTELAYDVYKSLKLKPQQTYSQAEKELYNFVDRTEFIKEDFTIRLDNVIRQLCIQEADTDENIEKQRDNFSKILHDDIITHLRLLLGNALCNKNRVYILVDNLDKAWDKTEDLRALSLFLFGLLNVIERISVDFQRTDSRKQSIPLTLVIFIRSDILEIIRNYAQERDKLRITTVDWRDETQLLHVIEKRFKNALGDSISTSEVWENYFPRNINGTPIKRYLLDYTLPRPRDIIYFCKQALFNAIMHEHTRIEQDDIENAQKDYSNYIYDRMVEETDSQIPDIEVVLRKFLNAEEIVTRQYIEASVLDARISGLESDKVIDLLIDANFLGFETTFEHFTFVYDNRKEDRREQAKRVAESTGLERYRINPPFHKRFEIVPSS